MIRTLTLNPAVDRTLVVEQLATNTVMRASEVRDAAGGKGINVLRTVHALGGEAEGIVLLGGALGSYFRELCDPGWRIAVVPITEQTRLNVEVVRQDLGESLKINERGPHITTTEVQTVLDVLDRRLDGGWLAVCGALPAGVDEHVLTAIVATARERGTQLAVDIPELSPQTLTQLTPNVVKVNCTELHQLLGRVPASDHDPSASAHELRARAGAEVVIVGLGGEGAVLATADTTLRLPVPVPVSAKPVGAGDALLAGFLLGCQRGWPLERCFLHGMSAAIISVHRDRSPERANVETMMRSLALELHIEGELCR